MIIWKNVSDLAQKFRHSTIFTQLPKIILPAISLFILLVTLGITTYIAQLKQKADISKAQINSDIQLSPGQSLNFEASNLLPNRPTTFNIWHLNPNPPSTSKIGLSGVFLAWETLPEVLSAFNKSYGDKIVGTSDDVNPDAQIQKHLYLLMSAGVKTIGMGFEWKRVETSATSGFDWTFYDRVFDAIKSFSDNYGYTFEPVVYLDSPARWASSAPSTSNTPARFPPKDLWLNNNSSNPLNNLNPAGSARYNNFVSQAAARYRPSGLKAPNSSFGIKHWVIWNEANWEFFRDPSDPSGQRYCLQ